MNTGEPDKFTVFLNPWRQRLIGLLVFAASASLLVCLSLFYQKHYVSLAAFHVEGLALMVLIAFGMAATSAPFFAESLATDPKDKPKDHFEAMSLYVNVTLITLVALSLVFSVLWIVGWIMEFGKLGLALFKRWLLGPA